MKKLKQFSALILVLFLVLGLSIPALATVENTSFSDVGVDAYLHSWR